MSRISPLNSDMLWFEHMSRTKSPSLRLFCFPYAGGSAELYRSWQRWFPPEIDICLVHLPGRDRRISEQAFTRAMALVNEIANRIVEHINVPYAVYGHSMGALISFELARELCRRGNPGPRHVFVSGRSAPHWPRTQMATFQLPDDEFKAELRRLNGTPRDVLASPELMELFISLLRADFEIVETYEFHPAERLSCPITVYGGLHDEHVPIESCRAWQEQTSAVCKIRMVDGDHFFIRTPTTDFVAAFRTDILSAAPNP